MSIFIPYSSEKVIESLSTLLSLDLSILDNYQKAILVLISNAYFFGFWFFIIYFSLKVFNRVWERLF